MSIDTIEFLFADNYAGFYKSFALCISSINVVTGVRARRETLVLLNTMSTHNTTTTTVESRGRAEGRIGIVIKFFSQ